MIDLITYNQKTVRADYDATLYNQILGTNCVLQGMEMNLFDTGNKIEISNGFGIIRGRLFKVEEEELTVESLPGEFNEGQVIIKMDLENTENPIEFIVDKTNRPLESTETQYATFTLDGLGGIATKTQTLKRFYDNIKSLSTDIKETDESVKIIDSKLKTKEIQLQSLTETVTNQGTRINNQANRLTTLESKQYEYSIRQLVKANVEISANGSKSEEITISLESDERLIGWVDKWIDSSGTSSPANQTSCVCVNWWGSGTTRTVSVRNFANSKARITINISALVAKKV